MCSIRGEEKKDGERKKWADTVINGWLGGKVSFT
jgi:hypothetical protein